MDKEILEIIDLISQSNFVEFELEREGFRIKLVKAGPRAEPTQATLEAASRSAAPHHVPTAAAPVGVQPASSAATAHEVRSPLVGTFYRSPNPEAPSFTEVGRTVKAGQVLCIVEAMKLMNEIESDVRGRIAKIMVENAQPVEFGQVLFLVEAESAA